MTNNDNIENPDTDLPEDSEANDVNLSLDPQARIEQLEQEISELNSRLLRAHADYQNAVRRGQLNVTEARQQQIRDVALPLVSVIDHFDRAMEVDVESVSAASVLQGVQIVRDELLRSLEGFGVKRIEAEVGAEFDPHLHEALMQQPSEEIPSQHIVTELQPGYRLGERTLRPAKVIVAQ